MTCVCLLPGIDASPIAIGAGGLPAESVEGEGGAFADRVDLLDESAQAIVEEGGLVAGRIDESDLPPEVSFTSLGSHFRA